MAGARHGNDYVTLTTAADATNIPAGTLRNWIESGQLPAMASERGRQVRLADVWRLVEIDDATPGTDGAPPEATPSAAPALITQPPARRRQRVMTGSAAAGFMAKLDELYRAQIAAKDDEIATKNELIVELRLRAERAEQQVAALEQQLDAALAPVVQQLGEKLAPMVQEAAVAANEQVLTPVAPADAPTLHDEASATVPSRGLLARLVAWFRD